MWLLPSRGRPHLIARVFSKAPPTEAGLLVTDLDEIEEYASIDLPDRWSHLILPRMTLAQKLNAAVQTMPSEPWYGILNDDMVPETRGWDSELPKSAGAWGISWADDCLNHRIGAAAFGGELVRALGFLCLPAVRHFYIDDAHELIALELGVGLFRPDIKVAHVHFTAGAPYDRTYKERPSNSADKLAFENWKANEWPKEKLQVMEAMDL